MSVAVVADGVISLTFWEIHLSYEAALFFIHAGGVSTAITLSGLCGDHCSSDDTPREWRRLITRC
jgi:hypothetical protein